MHDCLYNESGDDSVGTGVERCGVGPLVGVRGGVAACGGLAVAASVMVNALSFSQSFARNAPHARNIQM